MAPRLSLLTLLLVAAPALAVAPLGYKLGGACWPGTTYYASATDACSSGGPAHDTHYGSPGCHVWTPSGMTCLFGPNGCGGSGSCPVAVFCPAGTAWTGTECVAPCTPAGCDDGSKCTVDSCLADGGCAHAPLCPDAGTACAPTTCDAAAGQCVTTFNDAGCACDPPQVTTATSSFEGNVSLGSRGCPRVVGGSFGAGLTWSGSVQGQLATCANGCASSLSATGTAGAEFSLCSSGTVTASASAALEKSTVQDTVCSAATCTTGCGGGACESLKATTSLDLKYSRFYGYQHTEQAPGFDLKVKCGGTLSAGASLSGNVDSTSTALQGPPAGGCASCVKNSLSLSGSAGASADCAVDFGFSRLRRTIGCTRCLSLDTTLTGAVGSSPSGCAGGACKSARADATLGVAVPGTEMSWRWWKVRGGCEGSVTACSELNSCGTCSCGGAACADVSTKFSCTVCGSGPLMAGLRACQ